MTERSPHVIVASTQQHIEKALSGKLRHQYKEIPSVVVAPRLC